jgi:putative protease
MQDVQEAGADAIIVQDLAVVSMARSGLDGKFEALRIPLHASTQCAIRTPEQARWLEGLGFSRLILERELSLEQIRAIREAVSCELEFFVHGALCVCYSGQCYLSELIAGRSANRGACIQACRSRYDLVDESGKVLVRDKALLSLKDYNLRGRLRELAEAGITSFKIEGRLKNESYVRNVVRDYSIGLDELVREGGFERESFGVISGGFTPDTSKTFNRGYTELFLDGKRGKWASMDAAKSMGELVGSVSSIGRNGIEVKLNPGVVLGNGDGFSFVSRTGNVEGFRGDVCSGSSIRCRVLPSLFVGVQLYRNINAAFEKEIERQACVREIPVKVSLEARSVEGGWSLSAEAVLEDGRMVHAEFDAGMQKADNQERMLGVIKTQMTKSAGHYRFALASVSSAEGVPFMSASFLNGIRRTLAEMLDAEPAGSRPLLNRALNDAEVTAIPSGKATYKQNIANRLSSEIYRIAGASAAEEAYELSHTPDAELMRTKYCIRYELGICPVHQKGLGQHLPSNLRDIKPDTRLFLLNNGRRLALGFDCRRCEMTVKEA